MRENGQLIPLSLPADVFDEGGRLLTRALPEQGEPLPALVEIDSDDLGWESEAGQGRRTRATALLEGFPETFSRCLLSKNGEDFGEFRARRFQRIEMMNRTRVTLEQE